MAVWGEFEGGRDGAMRRGSENGDEPLGGRCGSRRYLPWTELESFVAEEAFAAARGLLDLLGDTAGNVWLARVAAFF